MRDEPIRLTVPADPDMRAVVVVAVAAVARTAGMGDAVVAEVRDHADAAFTEVWERGTGDVITLTAWAERHECSYELHREGWTERGSKRSGS
jgi:hypothetical protein